MALPNDPMTPALPYKASATVSQPARSMSDIIAEQNRAYMNKPENKQAPSAAPAKKAEPEKKDNLFTRGVKHFIPKEMGGNR